MTSEQVIDKVKKLLALAAGTPYEAEAQTAMALAQKLLLEHELSMGDVDRCSDANRNFTEQTVWKGGEIRNRQPACHPFVATIVEDFFFCVPVIVPRHVDSSRIDRPTRVVLFGRPEHVAVGIYVYGFLTRIFLALWPPYKRANLLGQGSRYPFWAGMMHGLAGRLSRERREIISHADRAAATGAEQRLAVINRDLNQAAGVHFGGLENRRIRSDRFDDAAYSDGVRRGHAIDIRKPLPAPAGQARLTEGN